MILVFILNPFTLRAATLVPTSYGFRLPITFSNPVFSGTLTHVPLLVTFDTNTPNFYGGLASPADGGDLRFTDGDGRTLLNHEIEAWNTNGESFVWVQASAFSTSSVIYVYWGNEGDASPPAYSMNGATWSEGYLSVVHLHDDENDSTSNRNDGVAAGATNAPGQVADAIAFNGTNEYVNFGDVNAFDNPGFFTVSLWFNRRVDGPAGSSHGIQNVLVSQASSFNNDNFEVGVRGTDIEVYVDSVGQDGPNNLGFPATVSNGVWHYLSLVYDQSNTVEASIYLDGRLVGTYSNWGGTLDNSAGSPLGIGIGRPTTSNNGDFDGTIDEFRLALAPRSS
ncbi:MAG: DUF2341 domain-containing protein, partial [Verrucomicrobiota bacterium]